MKITSERKAYLAGFLDGDGSIYVRMKPNETYRYGFQISPYVVFFQSKKDRKKFEQICSFVNLGYIRERKDGILEYILGKEQSIREFLEMVEPFLVLKKDQAHLMIEILNAKSKVKNKDDFRSLAELVERFRILNYSKK